MRAFIQSIICPPIPTCSPGVPNDAYLIHHMTAYSTCALVVLLVLIYVVGTIKLGFRDNMKYNAPIIAACFLVFIFLIMGSMGIQMQSKSAVAAKIIPKPKYFQKTVAYFCPPLVTCPPPIPAGFYIIDHFKAHLTLMAIFCLCFMPIIVRFVQSMIEQKSKHNAKFINITRYLSEFEGESIFADLFPGILEGDVDSLKVMATRLIKDRRAFPIRSSHPRDFDEFFEEIGLKAFWDTLINEEFNNFTDEDFNFVDEYVAKNPINTEKVRKEHEIMKKIQSCSSIIKTQNFVKSGPSELLRIVGQILPLGPNGWDDVLSEYQIKFPDSQRDAEALKSRFMRLRNTKKPTGTARIPDDVLRAKQIAKKFNL